ncbi:hypothetical protein PseudUWO311_18490 [Pseudanabaena sp. UWO311]|uniref:hypothetical protein n=1 Tax=Pseudanabaena sp. UWO311 TaxID=2487337 RepID=UPI00115BEA18|nr:hypothetical protein [Pseudanabaena sp. UWO311]TYQ24573.1 hypothetical protein PseudUWO311_18490 [Pseudanabaena sp. UWO311]
MSDTQKAKILEDLRTRLGLPKPAGEYLKITQVEDILISDFDIKIDSKMVSFPIWRVTIQAQEQSWVYLAYHDESIAFDAVASVPEKVRIALAKKMRIPSVKDLQIKAAELVTNMRQCPINAGCLAGYELNWRILAANENSVKIYDFDQEGADWQRWSKEQISSNGLPTKVKSAVMQDVINRSLIIPPNLNIESIKPVTWNDCGSAGIDSPTPMPRGTCANVSFSGWQMRVRSGAIIYTYYVQSNIDSLPVPDGMQSIPPTVLEQVKQDIAQRTKALAQNIRVMTVLPQYFDRCLDAAGKDCQNGIIAGWQVMAVSDTVRGDGAQASWLYHTSLNGEQIRFVKLGPYFAIPAFVTPVLPR